MLFILRLSRFGGIGHISESSGIMKTLGFHHSAYEPVAHFGSPSSCFGFLISLKFISRSSLFKVRSYSRIMENLWVHSDILVHSLNQVKKFVMCSCFHLYFESHQCLVSWAQYVYKCWHKYILNVIYILEFISNLL